MLKEEQKNLKLLQEKLQLISRERTEPEKVTKDKCWKMLKVGKDG